MYEILKEIGFIFLIASLGTIIYIYILSRVTARRRKIIDFDLNTNKGNYFKGNLK